MIKALFVRRDGELPVRTLESVSIDDFPPGNVVVDVQYSSLNYKDALAATAHPGVVRTFPMIPGIDAAGVVVDSDRDELPVGANVLISHADFGTSAWGGWSETVRVPAEWVLPLPVGLSLADAMSLGTAGFTAAQCVREIRRHPTDASAGPVVVSGATGGVGVFAVRFLSELGYQVVASTGKPDRADWLRQQGADSVIDRSALDDTSGRPLLSAKWAAAVDTVGGNTLATIVRSAALNSCVTACGVVGGADLGLTVYPFILRGISLCGIDSANVSRTDRMTIWQELVDTFKTDDLADLTTIVSLDEIETSIDRILRGQIAGRVVVRLNH